MESLNGLLSVMSGSSLPADVSLSMLSKVLDQSEALSAELMADMPPPAGLSELGGLLDTFA
ncbi:hypothetical protein FACS1894120_0790 [Clostridia bacterium]|nr:hypothetical protein FACS1894120_0790 [Clostridia bacterium]